MKQFQIIRMIELGAKPGAGQQVVVLSRSRIRLVVVQRADTESKATTLGQKQSNVLAANSPDIAGY